jgi:hypothetical protein
LRFSVARTLSNPGGRVREKSKFAMPFNADSAVQPLR